MESYHTAESLEPPACTEAGDGVEQAQVQGQYSVWVHSQDISGLEVKMILKITAVDQLRKVIEIVYGMALNVPIQGQICGHTGIW